MTRTGNKIIAFTKCYFNEYSNQAKTKNLTFDDDQAVFVFYLLDKIVENFAAVGEMMKLSEKEGMSYLKNSIYILLRSNLSDVIIAFWLLYSTDSKLGDDEQTILSEKIKELKRDHIRFHVGYLQKMQSLGLLPAIEKMEELKIINSNYSHLLTGEIKADLNIKTIPRSTSITDMLSPSNKDNSALVEAYKCYSLFSKIEHTGEFTRMMLEKTFQTENPIDQYVENAIHIIESAIKAFTPVFFTRKEFIDEISSFKVVE